jgi:hypothetical protein
MLRLASRKAYVLGTYPTIELDGDVTRLRATMVPGVKRMPVRLGVLGDEA